MTRPIFFTTSCRRDRENGAQAAVAGSWLKTWGRLIEHRFILGAGNERYGAPGELVVDYGDTYAEITGKNLLALKWALEQGYTHMFIGDTDTYVSVPRMLASGFEEHDYAGRRCDEGHAGQGCGFMLGAKAVKACMDINPIGHSWFDMMIGLHLRDAHGIHLHDDPRYYFSPNVVPTVDEFCRHSPVTVNLGRITNKFDHTLLADCHAADLEASS